MRKSLSIGKLRGLQQLADPMGILTVCAMDHRASLQRSLTNYVSIVLRIGCHNEI